MHLLCEWSFTKCSFDSKDGKTLVCDSQNADGAEVSHQTKRRKLEVKSLKKKAKQGKARSLIVHEKSIEIWYEPDRFPALQPPTSYLLQPIVTQLCYPGISFQVLSLKKLSWLSMFGNNRRYVRILWEKNLRSLHCRIAEIYASIWMELWVLWNWVTRVARSSSLPFCHRASQHFCRIWKWLYFQDKLYIVI